MKKILLLMLLVVSTNGLFAETGKEALESCAKAMKCEKFAEFKTQKIVYAAKNGQMTADIAVYKKGTDKLRIEIKTPMGNNVFIKNGDNRFIIEPQKQEIPAEQWEPLEQEIMLYEANPLELFKDASYTFELVADKEEFNSRACKKIGIKSEGVMGTYIYTDAATNWIVGTKIDNSEMPIDIQYLDMKKIKGAVYPSLIKMFSKGMLANEISINSWEVDIELADSMFEVK